MRKEDLEYKLKGRDCREGVVDRRDPGRGRLVVHLKIEDRPTFAKLRALEREARCAKGLPEGEFQNKTATINKDPLGSLAMPWRD